jgi:hypothetical protein
VQPVRRILFSSLVVCAAALTIGAFFALERESATESVRPQRVAAAQSPAREREPRPTSGAHQPAQQSPERQLVDTPSSVDTVTDEQIEAVFTAHPELRPSIEELLNDPDPSVRQQAAAMVLELAAATAQTAPSQ